MALNDVIPASPVQRSEPFVAPSASKCGGPGPSVPLRYTTPPATDNPAASPVVLDHSGVHNAGEPVQLVVPLMSKATVWPLTPLPVAMPRKTLVPSTTGWRALQASPIAHGAV